MSLNGPGEVDPRLADPDGYFVERYGDAVIQYGKFELPLAKAIEIERGMRGPEKLAAAPKAQRANKHISLLKNAGVLAPEDDVTYPEDK